MDRLAFGLPVSPKMQHRQVHFLQHFVPSFRVVGEESAGCETASQ
jgi:hypothetical protein